MSGPSQRPRPAIGPPADDGPDTVRDRDPARRRLLTVKEAAAVFGCSEANVYALIEAGELPYVPIGRRKGYRIDVADLDAFIAGRKRQQDVAAPPPKPRRTLKHIRLPARGERPH